MTGKKLRKIIQQLLLLFCMIKIEKIYPPYVSISYSNREKQVILVMIPNGEGWHYLALKKLSASLRGKPSNATVIFIACIAFILLQQKINVNFIKKVYENKDFCNVVN